MNSRVVFVWLAFVAFGAATPARASRVTVPDDFLTIQQAVDSSLADTITVRSGSYPEVPRIMFRRLVLEAAVGEPSGAPPELGGLFLSSPGGDVYIRGIHFKGPAIVEWTDDYYDMCFESCIFDSTFRVGVSYDGYVAARRCTMARGARLVGRAVLADSNLVRGTLDIESEYGVHAVGNTVGGPGSGIRSDAYHGGATVVGNTVSGGSFGIDLKLEYGCIVSGNTVEACVGTGIRVANDDGEIVIRDNSVRGCAQDGIFVTSSHAGPIRVVKNVVGRCGQDGIEVGRQMRVVVDGNTVYANAGRGIVTWACDAEKEPVCPTVTRNVGHGNGGAGLQAAALDSWVGCNDWYGNLGGNAGGPTDVSIDPIFCDLANDDVSLRADSPLLSGTCGTVGAGALGCDDATEVLVVLFVAERTDNGVRIRWYLGGDEQPASTWIERATGDAGPWSRIITDRTHEGNATVDVDRTADSERGYWYRLAWRVANREEHSAPVEAGPGKAVTFGVEDVSPNPISGEALVRFSTARASKIELTVHDVMGREMGRLLSGQVRAGSHKARWSGRGVKPGVYFLRLRWDRGEESRRIVVLQ